MFDLDLSLNCNAGGKEQSPATSPSSVVNAGDVDFTSSNDDTCSARASPATFTFSFDILNNNTTINRDHIFVNDDDQGLTTGSGGLVTRELLPVSRLGELNSEVQPQQPQVQLGQARKSRRGPRSRSSQYRGVTFYRRTGRWESHIWDCGKQVYLGGFDTALVATRAYDRAAIKFRGVDADINFNVIDYEEDMKQMKNMSKEEFVHILRRQSNGFSRGSSKYRGVTLHKKAYDKADIQCNGRDVVTNYEPSVYDGEMTLESRNEGSQQDLDLNLGISTSPTKTNKRLSLFQLHPYDVHNATTLKVHVENLATTSVGDRPLKGVPITSEQYPTFWSGVNPNFANNYEGRAVEQRTKSVSPEEVAKWARQMHNHVRGTPNETLSAAASSGFSNSTSSYHMALNLSFLPHHNTSTNTSHRVKPFLPPS